MAARSRSLGGPGRLARRLRRGRPAPSAAGVASALAFELSCGHDRSISSRSSVSFSSSERGELRRAARGCPMIRQRASHCASSIRACCSRSRLRRASPRRSRSLPDPSARTISWLAHAVLLDHRAADLGDPAQVVGGAGGDAAEHDLLGDAAAEQHLQVVDQLLLGPQVAVLLGEVERVAERRPRGMIEILCTCVDRGQELARRARGRPRGRRSPSSPPA